MDTPEPIHTLIALAESLEAEIASAAQAAGRGPAGLALNTAKTQLMLARGALLIAQQGSATVGSG